MDSRIGALRKLVDQVKAVIDNDELASIFILAAVHGNPYNGPVIDRVVLKSAEEAVTSLEEDNPLSVDRNAPS